MSARGLINSQLLNQPPTEDDNCPHADSYYINADALSGAASVLQRSSLMHRNSLVASWDTFMKHLGSSKNGGFTPIYGKFNGEKNDLNHAILGVPCRYPSLRQSHWI